MKKLCAMFILLLLSTVSFAEKDIQLIKSCELKQKERVGLLSLKTIDGNTLYLKFKNIITGAFLDNHGKSYDYTGDIVLSRCINESLFFALNYGSPYIKGCLVTGWENGEKGKNSPEGLCFAERNIPESIWFGESNILVVIRNQKGVGSWGGEYIIYDNAKNAGERAYSSDTLPSVKGYTIFYINK